MIYNFSLQEQCMTTCITQLNGMKLDRDEEICLKNCSGKIQNYAKVAKSVGFPIV